MASSIMALSSTAAVAAVAAPSKTGNSNVVSAFTGLKSMAQFPSSKTMSNAGAEWEQKTTSNGSRVRCMQVWPPYANKKFETLSYLPRLTPEQLVKEVEYLLKNKWVPCLEFEEDGEIKRVYGNSPGYYDGRYWVMWKLPMFGCTEASQVLNEVNECAKAYPNAFIRVIGFDNVRQVQCISFIVHKPEYN
uniref:Ribulose bisphosphate carboxylase small subunit, chloroplastic n=5 Tax=Larix laricina TaxID=3326 RepID=RBS_LARLA|nr:RecName: Full=Ribulose bisphosphate carboxylase small subunit, chloroplastic; Short=RuBisCO small subunit; Flags: Precursor [Larix laricina]CAA34161.1 ribulose-1,5-carboxylase/oxygenase [Larix laricina]